MDSTIRERLERSLDDLPVLPTVVARLMALDASADDYFENVLELLESEPNFAARILIAANSAASAPRSPITTLPAAVARIGSGGASNLVLALAVARVFVPRDDWEKSLWRHAVQVAVAARLLAAVARDPGVSPDEAYAVGLLHDIGRFVMFKEAPNALRAIDEGDWETPEALVAEERSICGLTHGELGAAACRKWRLPDEISYIVEHHHDVQGGNRAQPLDRLIAILQLADLAMFPSTMPGTPGLEDAEDAVLEEALGPAIPAAIRLTIDELRSLISAASTDAEVTLSALGLGA